MEPDWRIYKYDVLLDEPWKLELPRGARVLSVQEQGLTPRMWVLGDVNAPVETRTFQVFGTGHPIPTSDIRAGMRFIDTYQLMGGSLVFHLFEIGAAS